MKHFILGFLVLSMSSPIIALEENRSQVAGSSDQQQSSATTSSEEPKGEVDLLIEELAKKPVNDLYS